nr:class I SAM-dependent methyltransferase [Kineococcus aurantiacus]
MSPAGREQRRREARIRVDWLETHRPQGALLEVGAGTGEFARAAQDDGYTVVALESDARAARECEQLGLATLAGSIADLRVSLRDNTLDAVAAWHVLPRLPEPAEFLRHVRALLKTGGHLLLEVPNGEAWTARRDPARWLAEHPGHLHHFSERGLRALLEQEGFRVVTSLPFTTRVYDAASTWDLRTREWRRAGGEPPLELLRVVAVVV